MNMSSKKDIISREIEQRDKDALLEKYKTALKKTQFLNEIKNGLGEELKKNPSGVKIIKKTWFQKFMLNLKKIFTKF